MPEPYRLISGDPDPAEVHQLTLVPFLPDGRCAAIPGAPHLGLPSGPVHPGEHYLLDTALRIPLEQLGFRPQRIHPFAAAGTHLYAWIHGDRYSGRRPHATIEPITGTPQEIAARAHPTQAQPILDAQLSFTTQPPESYFADNLRLLEPAYLRATTVFGGSGFGGDATRWRIAREPILDAIPHSGTFLDLGCANGLLMESIHLWAAERALTIEPYGVDLSPRLVALARSRLPHWSPRIQVGNALTYHPPPHLPAHYTFVHTLLDTVPTHLRSALITHTLTLVQPGGRLLISHYLSPGATDLPAHTHLHHLNFPTHSHTPTTATIEVPKP